MHVKWLGDCGRRLGFIRQDFVLDVVEDSPEDDAIPQGTLVLERRGGFDKWAYLICPRCAERIDLPLGSSKETWRVREDWLGRPSVDPSIWETGSCGAHFFIRKGKIIGS